MSKNEEVGFASALRAGVGPGMARIHLRDLITERLHAYDCGCNSRVHPQERWDDYAAAADAVMDLFVDVSVDGPAPFRFLLRTAPTAEGGGEADQSNGVDHA